MKSTSRKEKKYLAVPKIQYYAYHYITIVILLLNFALSQKAKSMFEDYLEHNNNAIILYSLYINNMLAIFSLFVTCAVLFDLFAVQYHFAERSFLVSCISYLSSRYGLPTLFQGFNFGYTRINGTVNKEVFTLTDPEVLANDLQFRKAKDIDVNKNNYIKKLLQKEIARKQSEKGYNLDFSNSSANVETSFSSILDQDTIEGSQSIYSVKKSYLDSLNKSLYLTGLDNTFSSKLAISDNSLHGMNKDRLNMNKKYLKIGGISQKTTVKPFYTNQFIENQSLRTFIKFRSILNSKSIPAKINQYNGLLNQKETNLNTFLSLLDDLNHPFKFTETNYIELFYYVKPNNNKFKRQSDESLMNFDKKKYLENLFGEVEYNEIVNGGSYIKKGDELKKFIIKTNNQKVNDILDKNDGVFIVKSNVFTKEESIMVDNNEHFYLIVNQDKEGYFVKVENSDEIIIKLFISFSRNCKSKTSKSLIEYLNK